MQERWSCESMKGNIGEVHFNTLVNYKIAKNKCDETFEICKNYKCIPLPLLHKDDVIKKTKWSCILNNKNVGDITIKWGHTKVDATWTCNNWNIQCINGNRKCTTQQDLRI